MYLALRTEGFWESESFGKQGPSSPLGKRLPSSPLCFKYLKDVQLVTLGPAHTSFSHPDTLAGLCEGAGL